MKQFREMLSFAKIFDRKFRNLRVSEVSDSADTEFYPYTQSSICLSFILLFGY